MFKMLIFAIILGIAFGAISYNTKTEKVVFDTEKASQAASDIKEFVSSNVEIKGK